MRAFGMIMHTLLYLKWIINKDILYSTGNSAQCYAAAWIGVGFGGRMDTCIRVAESLCCSTETITALLISYTSIQKFKNKKKKRKEKKSFKG